MARRGGFLSTGEMPGGAGSATVGGSQVVSPLALPELMALFQQIQGQIPARESMPSLQGMIQGGVQSPLLQAVLGPALERLQAPQAQQRQQLTEATRAAGGLRGSTYGQDFNRLLQNQALQSNDLIGQVIQQMLTPLITGQLQEQRQQFLPAEALTNLLTAARPQVGRGAASASSGWENISPSLGLQTPMTGDTSFGGVMGGGGGMGTADILRRLSGGGGVTGGVNAPTMGGGSQGGGMTTPYTPYLEPLAGGPGGGSYDLGMGAGTQYLHSPATATPTPTLSYGVPQPEWNPTTGAYQGGYQPEVVTEGWW